MSALTDEGPAEPIGIERRIERDWALGFRLHSELRARREIAVQSCCLDYPWRLGKFTRAGRLVRSGGHFLTCVITRIEKLQHTVPRFLPVNPFS